MKQRNPRLFTVRLLCRSCSEAKKKGKMQPSPLCETKQRAATLLKSRRSQNRKMQPSPICETKQRAVTLLKSRRSQKRKNAAEPSMRNKTKSTHLVEIAFVGAVAIHQMAKELQGRQRYGPVTSLHRPAQLPGA